MTKILIHLKPEYLPDVQRLGLSYTHSENDEIDVVVNDLDYDPNHYLVDPDEQLCELYGINYNYVNCMEKA
tara:strand:+ start:564 stop:776 length:213 start_codon:yes stop_codon:yes gene_type:complete